MKINLTLLFQFVIISLHCQTLKPIFSFVLYGEDARGKKDSITFAYHPDARTDEVLDTRFGDKRYFKCKF